jgi:phosphoglycolate phosphatase-like HAD superfamily hydrolase
MKYKAVLFDLDGTLIYTPLDYITLTINRVLSAMGAKSLSQEEAARVWFSPNVDELVNGLVTNPSQFWQLFRQYDNPMSRSSVISAYKDNHILSELQAKGITLGIITATPKEIADKEIALLQGIRFGSVIYAQPIYGVKPKPNPESVNLSLQILGVSREQTIFIGNGIEDVITAKNAGTTGFFLQRPEYPYLLNLEPTKKIKLLTELKEFVL